MEVREEIKNKALEILKKNNFFFIDFVWRGSEQHPVLELFMDNAKGVTADDCYAISRELEQFIDENGLLKKYRLDVSSPGVDKPLIYLEQYPKHIGRKFSVEYDENGKTKEIEGKLISVSDDNLSFELSKKNKNTVEIDFHKIKKAKVLISF